ncbi:hypothetical protein BU24DRAFT_485266 [Aaosphaeria arxii CBS 175.79]|uniref:Fumarylacetoacetase-like C-terminal domain-containing protein n=1 Tax=Aaosphaeria arxii CBS 175.79 TaxID=1450172 RepID=A0A6A5XGB5_9PLEO|nr:uncharacterized protein BU24DRAFT_485266 [Aaosphaeria arxii CBS 175.79]KAF2011973.1 hypothetical protein BU24DRAFT_485266 [Aaosphaeria arxii CBS 175.79]
MNFEKLVRFEHGGVVSYGDLQAEEDGQYTVKPLDGTPFTTLKAKNVPPVRVEKLLCPLEGTPIIICVGLNYRKHATDANIPVPKYPVIFTKPPTALHGPNEIVSIHSTCQTHLDYEGELTFVTSKDLKNLPLTGDFDLSDYVLGYTAGNDISARNFQDPKVSGGQFCYAKSFDGFAPIGPYIVNSRLIPDPQKLHYTTKVNGEERQSTGTDDMIWSVKEILRHCSQGTTIKAGTVFMSGTPSGVGIFCDGLLKDGDIVEVDIGGVGNLVSTIKFEKQDANL